jgi:hypothetical protein
VQPSNRSAMSDNPPRNDERNGVSDADIAAIVEHFRDTHHVRTLRPATRFTRSLAFWAPRRFVSSTEIDVDGFVEHLDGMISSRGMVLYDRQIATTLLEKAEAIESFFERDTAPFPEPAHFEWGPKQREYFGLDDPYQMAEHPGDFTYSHIVVHTAEPYLQPGELIAGLLHGVTDSYYYGCGCHRYDTVYTTRHRLVCMGCGFTHLVLDAALAVPPGGLLTAEEWVELFDHDGIRRDDEVEVPLVDFCDVEHAPFIWSTERWDDASHELTFFARSSEQEIWEAIRGTEMVPTILMEAGWTRVDEAPPPALQVRQDAITVDALRIATFAFNEGAAAYFASAVDPERLLSAVPELFRTVELLLKARLETLDADALRDRPNNPTVLDRLRNHGITIDTKETDTITRLRRMRNDLQHESASFNNRTGRRVCLEALLFIDRFTRDELGLWVGDAATDGTWWQLLSIPEIAETAALEVENRIAPARSDPEADIVDCPRCERNTLIRPHPSTGACCAFCGHVPVEPDD